MESKRGVLAEMGGPTIASNMCYSEARGPVGCMCLARDPCRQSVAGCMSRSTHLGRPSGQCRMVHSRGDMGPELPISCSSGCTPAASRWLDVCAGENVPPSCRQIPDLVGTVGGWSRLSLVGCMRTSCGLRDASCCMVVGPTTPKGCISSKGSFLHTEKGANAVRTDCNQRFPGDECPFRGTKKMGTPLRPGEGAYSQGCHEGPANEGFALEGMMRLGSEG